ncbi:MAG: M64 family metallopeptidase [Bryobacteraceae bacterium]
MSAQDGKVIGAVKILDNGDPAKRFNLVLVAEGFKQSELGDFAGYAQDFVDGLFAIAPFDQHSCAINVWRLDVASTDSGADDPAGCGGTGATPHTYFDATFCGGGVPRALVCDTTLVQNTVQAWVPQYHSAQVIVNTKKYGGTGGAVGVASVATKNSKGENVDWREILIHEMGHSIFGLADEYPYLQGCDSGEIDRNHYSGPEPGKPNITTHGDASGKWSDLVNTSTPTWTNPNCSKCPPDPGAPGGPSNNDVVIGTLEGAGTYHCGLYRPQANCKMRKLGQPFCAVCEREIDEYLKPYDAEQCLKLKRIDLSKWAAVATILFGVIQDGGGVIIVGGVPIPIDPWGPLRQSIWGAMANPHEASPAMRDLVTGIALQQLSTIVASPGAAARIGAAANALVNEAAARLPVATIR